MNDEDIKRIVDDPGGYDEAREDSLLRMAGEFYGRKMRPIVIILWINAVLAITLAAFSAMQFFRTDQVKQEIMYATLFLIGMGWMSGAKILAWIFFSRHLVAREIKRLEIRLSEACVELRRQSSS